jgi:O-methyltransferase/methyltransferase family protein
MEPIARGSSPADREVGTADPMQASATVLRMIQGLLISRAVYVAAKLAIPDLLENGPRTSDELARLTKSHPAALYRVLRLLTALGIFTEPEPGSFGLSPLGDRLRTGVQGSVRKWALLTDGLGGLRAFDNILEAVRTGEPAFDSAFGMGTFEYLAGHPEAAVAFDAAMSERTSVFAPSVASAYDFSPMRTIVDVGGGHATLIIAILAAHPNLRGVILDLANVVPGAEAKIKAAGVADRCQVIAGDFFESVPSGADCYIMANVLHDWTDERSIDILRNCRRAMPGGAKVLVVERMIFSDRVQSIPTLISDINMLVITGGMERTDDEYTRLFAEAGLNLTHVLPVAFPYGIFEASQR